MYIINLYFIFQFLFIKTRNTKTNEEPLTSINIIIKLKYYLLEIHVKISLKSNLRKSTGTN